MSRQSNGHSYSYPFPNRVIGESALLWHPEDWLEVVTCRLSFREIIGRTCAEIDGICQRPWSNDDRMFGAGVR